MKKYVLIIWSLLVGFGFVAIFQLHSLAYMKTFGNLTSHLIPLTRNSILQPVEGNQTPLKFITDSMKQNRSPVHVLWKDDAECKKFDVRLGKDLKLRYLASFPGSGNTWIRYLIEAATGIFTGSIFNDSTLTKLGFLGEREKASSGKTIVVKHHGNVWSKRSVLYKTKNPVVLVIRHVEAASLSYWNYLDKRSHTKPASTNSLKTKGFRKHANKTGETWRLMNEECLKTCEDLLVIFYENVKKDPVAEVTRIVHFMGYEPDPERLKCLGKNLVGPAKRNPLEVKDPFLQNEKQKMMNEMKKVLQLLEARNVEAPDEYYSYVQNNV